MGNILITECDRVKTIGEKIKVRRAELKLNQAQLSRLCGWESQSRISQYEGNKREPTITDIKTIAKALKIAPTELLLAETSKTYSKKVLPTNKESSYYFDWKVSDVIKLNKLWS